MGLAVDRWKARRSTWCLDGLDGTWASGGSATSRGRTLACRYFGASGTRPGFSSVSPVTHSLGWVRQLMGALALYEH